MSRPELNNEHDALPPEAMTQGSNPVPELRRDELNPDTYACERIMTRRAQQKQAPCVRSVYGTAVHA
ncbi:hypothetical protein Lgee_0896 [Legionella geestiana]|uniref:Uncharacterized protein n=1 Tax=Legionella geestiana TaxID=45065 RepID=A0A0W0TZS7_9GAMM|nr:hypothetical protein Lgee_0896 [Legionella geestiana]STX53262.1 Uncharacterised protein [Legionella geestiana]